MEIDNQSPEPEVQKINMTESGEYIIESAHKKLFDWKEIWRYRELFYFYTWRDIKVKYKQTALGFLWVILQPLIMMVIFTVFFGAALNVSSQNLPYPVFVLSGLLLWNAFSSGISTSANSMVNNSAIIKKIYFPRLIIPVSSILVALFDFIITFILFIPILIFYKQSVSAAALWCWPSAVLISLIATVGPGCWLAALNVKYRDFRYVIPFLIQILFFLTPIIYPLSTLKYPLLRYMLAASPMYTAVELFRFPLTGSFPETTYVYIGLISMLIFLFVGLIYFKRTEDFFADFV